MDLKNDTDNTNVLMKEGFRLYGLCKDQEAITTYQKVIDLDPNHLSAYLQKAFILERQRGSDHEKAAIECCKMAESKNSSSAAGQACIALRLYLERKYDDSVHAFDKAINIDQNDSTNYVLKGHYLMLRSKFEEACKTFDQAISKDPNNILAHTFKIFAIANSGNYYDMVNCFEKAVSIDPNFVLTHLYKSNALYLYSQGEEGIKAADICLHSNPEHTGALSAKASNLGRAHRFEEALALQKKCCELNPSALVYASNYTSSLLEMGKLEECLSELNRILSIEPNYTMVLCKRGDVLNKLGRIEEALKDFIKARELLQTGESFGMVSASNRIFIDGILAKVEELEKTAKQTSTQIEEVTKDYDKANPVVQKFVENLKRLDQNKNKTATKALACFNDNSGDKKATVEKEIETLKQQYVDLKKQFEQEIKEVKANAQKMEENAKKMEEKIEKIQQDIAGIKDELDTKMDNFNKKLDKELARLDLPSDDIAKVKDYFNAFINTFSSLYVTAQVIDSGQVSLDASSNKATVLSALASFTPFVGSFLSTGIKSIGDFLESREMKSNARKMKNAASDSTELSQLVGSAAYQIATNKKKQQQIIQVTLQEMKNKADGTFAKILEFCKNVGEQTDAMLYGKLYKTPSAQLGHQDANMIIERWLNVSIDVMDTEGAFVRIALGEEEIPMPNEKANGTQKGTNGGRSACCSLF